MKVDFYTASGEKKGTVDLKEQIFGAKINPDLMHRAVIMRLANAREPIAHTKTRAEVAYSTRKIFRQKGTGNARRGARSTNLLRGGGVTHGPRNNVNYSKMMPKKERRAALFSSLTLKANEKSIFGFEGYKGKAPKTKDFAELLGKLPETKKYLFVLSEKNEVFEKSCRNIHGVKTILAIYLNPYDVLLADKLYFVGDALSKTEATFLGTK
ncbi:50S ribosomal protein L4 [Candidatus Gracilibacteria bacterium]|nr:50S ribosomal protein L4 [Candidatus Gracilibacteria bacterium]